MVLWVLILALFGGVVAAFGRNLPPTLKANVLAVQASIAVAFVLFILFTSNPFLRVDPPPADGNGLNPILQDPGLAFHPPFLYTGYPGHAHNPEPLLAGLDFVTTKRTSRRSMWA